MGTFRPGSAWLHVFGGLAQLAERRVLSPQVVGSTPTAPTNTRGISSDGRAPPLHGGGQGFDSPMLHVEEVDHIDWCSFHPSAAAPITA